MKPSQKTIETMDSIQNIDKAMKIIAIAEKAIQSIREFPCGHKPNGVGGKCGACEALADWDRLFAGGKR